MRRKSRVFVPVVALLCLAAFSLRTLSPEFKKATSMTYWSDRWSGRDRYVPEVALLRKGEPTSKAVALTIDDGPYRITCGRILDELAAARVQATFFVVGSKVQRTPSLVKRMIEEGHEVGNHTMTHQRMDSLSAIEAHFEIARCAEAVSEATGREMTLFRPPGMRTSPAVLTLAKTFGYTTVDWTVGAKDFTGMNEKRMLVEPAPCTIVDRIMRNVANGSIIVLHDTPSTAKAIRPLVRRLRGEGYQIVTVSQMLASLPEPVWVAANPVSPKIAPKRAKKAYVKRKSKRSGPIQRMEVGEPEYLEAIPLQSFA